MFRIFYYPTSKKMEKRKILHIPCIRHKTRCGSGRLRTKSNIIICVIHNLSFFLRFYSNWDVTGGGFKLEYYSVCNNSRHLFPSCKKCIDSRHKYPKCLECEETGKAYPDCSTCLNSRLQPPNCVECINSKQEFPNCLTCINSHHKFPHCQQCTNTNAIFPHCGKINCGNTNSAKNMETIY